MATSKKLQQPYTALLLTNGNCSKQLLARSRYLLFKYKDTWTSSQKQRAQLILERYPLIRRAYDLSQKLGGIYRYCTCKEQAFKKLALWYNDVEASAIESFRTVSRTIETHYPGILNFFNNRSTNASAESFNAKINAFRASARGVRDINFLLFRLAQIYA